MKSYEAVTRGILLPHSHTILRVDGRAFHSYLRGAKKPFDTNFQHQMKLTAQALCKEVAGTVFAYGQSDEISLYLSDVEPQSQPWFGGVIQKMASVAAGFATASFMSVAGTDGMPHFDARVFTLPSLTEVQNYFIWRQNDAVRNSISMAAQANFSHKDLLNKNTHQMQDMLWTHWEINWNDYPDDLKRGYIVTRVEKPGTVTYNVKATGEQATTDVVRSAWEPMAAPHFVCELEMEDFIHGAG